MSIVPYIYVMTTLPGHDSELVNWRLSTGLPVTNSRSEIAHPFVPAGRRKTMVTGEGVRNVWVNFTSSAYDQILLTGRLSVVWEIGAWVSQKR